MQGSWVRSLTSFLNVKTPPSGVAAGVWVQVPSKVSAQQVETEGYLLLLTFPPGSSRNHCIALLNVPVVLGVRSSYTDVPWFICKQFCHVAILCCGVGIEERGPESGKVQSCELWWSPWLIMVVSTWLPLLPRGNYFSTLTIWLAKCFTFV